MKEAIPDEKLKALLNVLYNSYFNKWKRRAPQLSDQERQLAVNEIGRIYDQGKQYPIVEALCLAFYLEIDARSRGGTYALTARNIQVEGFIQDDD